MTGKCAWVVGMLTVVLSISGCTQGPAGSHVSNSIGSSGMFAGSSSEMATSEWMRIDHLNHHVQLKWIAGVNGEKNVNGYRNGVMNVVVPPGWTVDVVFLNALKGERHSAVIAPFASVGAEQPALAGAASRDAARGSPTGVKQRFSFTADQEGRYAMVCGVRGHRDSGMWATFTVSRNLASPRIYIQHQG